MPYEPSYPHRDDMELPLLKALLQLRGSVCFSVRGRQIEDILADHFKLSKEDREFASPNYHSEGNRKWRNHIQFVRAQLVEKGQLDNSRHGYWTISVKGYNRLGVPPPPNAPDTHATKKKTRVESALEQLQQIAGKSASVAPKPNGPGNA